MDRSITCVRFGQISSTIWHKTMSPGNIIAGFRSTRILPLIQPLCLVCSAFAANTLSDYQQSQSNDTTANPDAQVNMETVTTHMPTYVESSTILHEDPLPKPSTSTQRIEEDDVPLATLLIIYFKEIMSKPNDKRKNLKSRDVGQ